MPNLLAKRHQQAVFQSLATVNRAAGSASGTGYLPMQPIGSTAYTTNQTTGNTTETLVPGSGVSVQVSRAGYVLALAMVSAFMNQNPPIAAGNVRINAGGISESARLRYPFINSGLVSIVQTAYVLVLAQPGTYTWELVYYVDTSPDTITINDFHMDVFYLGA
jgi:hypothetical protein